MRLVMESFINESVLYRGLMEERMAVEWRILRQRMVTLVMEHLEAGPCLVEVLRYTHDDPENRRKRLEYVVLINEVPQWCPDTNSTVDVHVLERRIYEYGSSSSSQVYWRRTPPVYFPDPPTAPQEPTDDWI